MDNSRENKLLRAKERVEELKKFYSHLTTYILVISGLAVLNYWVNEFHYMWFLWAAFGWGIGMVSHALKTFRLNPFFGRNWEERKIKQFMEEDKNATDKWR
jgi:hypothetical protein